jgi:hypothetical protein
MTARLWRLENRFPRNAGNDEVQKQISFENDRQKSKNSSSILCANDDRKAKAEGLELGGVSALLAEWVLMGECPANIKCWQS